jgi:hypothetical protein
MALEVALSNPFRPVGQQMTTAYCVMSVDEFLPDMRRAIIRLAAFDGPCTKAQRRAGEIKPFQHAARREIVTGDLFDEYFSLAVLNQADSNLLRQAYRCATRSIPVPVIDPATGEPQVDANGSRLTTESNPWVGLSEV